MKLHVGLTHPTTVVSGLSTAVESSCIVLAIFVLEFVNLSVTHLKNRAAVHV